MGARQHTCVFCAAALQGVDCSASWQQMAGSNAAAGASWVQPQQEHPAGCTEGLIAHTHAGTAAPADQFTPGPNRWPFAAGPEMHGSSGGAGSNTQPPLDQPCQQHMMQQAAQQPHHLQQQDMRSCTPRRSSHHSWSGAPRSFPGGAGAAGSWAELSGGFEGPAVPEVWSNLPQQLQGVPSSAAAAADGTLPPMVGRVSQPRLSGHGFLDPHHLGARASECGVRSWLSRRVQQHHSSTACCSSRVHLAPSNNPQHPPRGWCCQP